MAFAEQRLQTFALLGGQGAHSAGEERENLTSSLTERSSRPVRMRS
jgi:hypothetical protein